MDINLRVRSTITNGYRIIGNDANATAFALDGVSADHTFLASPGFADGDDCTLSAFDNAIAWTSPGI